MNLRKPLILTALCVASFAHAGTTYTAAELHKQIDRGSPPPQGKAKSQTRSLDFGDCLKVVRDTEAATAAYPQTTVLSTTKLRIVKLWTNDAAMTITCSADDRKLTITTSPYL